MLIKDTHKAVKSLNEVGVPPEQAERIVGLFQEADDQAATRHDIELLRTDMSNEMSALRKDMSSKMETLRKDMDSKMKALRTDMDALRKDLTIKMYTVGLAIAGLMAALELL